MIDDHEWVLARIFHHIATATPYQRSQYLLATGIAILFSLIIARGTASWLPLHAFYLFVLTTTTTYFGLKYTQYFIYFFSITLITMILNGAHLTWQHEVHFIVCGGAIAVGLVFLQWLLIPGFRVRAVRSCRIKTLHALDGMSQALFVCLTNTDYKEDLYVFERRIHVQKTKYFSRVYRLIRLKNCHSEHLPEVRLFNLLMECAQLRRRVSDHTIFSLCRNELLAIAKAMSQIFCNMKWVIQQKSEVIDTEILNEQINQLENLFYSVINVASREPLAFLLFIAGLHAFCEEANDFCRAL